MAVALAARLWGLGRESLWLDEATSLMMARLPIPKLVELTAADIHPPLYYLLLHFWRYLGESEAALRGLSVLGGLLGVGLVFLLGRELFDAVTGLVAAVLMAVAPLHIWYSQEVRGYVWLAAFCLLAMWGLARWLAARGRQRSGEWLGLLAYVVGVTLALYIHYYTVFVILASNAIVLALSVPWVRRSGGAQALTARPGALVLWAVAQLLVVVLFLPWLPTFLKLVLGGGGGWVAQAGAPRVQALAATVVSFIVGGAQPCLPALVRRLVYAEFMVALGIGLARGAGLLGGKEGGEERVGLLQAGVHLALPLATAWLVSQFRPLYADRYLLPFLAPFLILVARGVTALPGRWLRVAALSLLLVGPLWATAAQVRELDNPDWRGLAAELAAAAQPGDVMILVPGWNDKPLDYYLQGRIPFGEYVPDPVDPTQPERSLPAVRRSIAGHRRAWLLWAKGHYTDRTGVVAGYLDREARRVQTREVPGVGELILYELAN